MVTGLHSPTAGYAHHCLRIAVRRWPVPLREELYREWSAELLAISGPGSLATRLAYGYHRIRFATSLVCSAGVTDEYEPRTLWSRVNTALPMLKVAGLLLIAPWVGFVMYVTLRFTGIHVAEILAVLARLSHNAETPVRQTVIGLSAAAACVIAGLIGLSTSRRLSELPRALVALPLGAGTAVLPILVPGTTAADAAAAGLAVALGLVLSKRIRFEKRWKRITAGASIGLAMGYLVATAIALPHMAAVNADLRYAAAWVPAALLEGEWISLGLVSDGLPATSHLNATLSIVIPLCFVFGFICMARHPSKEKA